MDVLGFYITLIVYPANIQDRDGAKLVFEAAKARPMAAQLEKIWADGGYRGQLEAWTREECGWDLEIVERPKDSAGFVLLPKRWICERSFAWQCGSRRLTIDYEETPESSRAWAILAQIRFMLRRLTS